MAHKMIKTSILITEFEELTAFKFGVLFSGRSVGGGIQMTINFQMAHKMKKIF